MKRAHVISGLMIVSLLLITTALVLMTRQGSAWMTLGAYVAPVGQFEDSPLWAEHYFSPSLWSQAIFSPMLAGLSAIGWAGITAVRIRRGPHRYCIAFGAPCATLALLTLAGGHAHTPLSLAVPWAAGAALFLQAAACWAARRSRLKDGAQ